MKEIAYLTSKPLLCSVKPDPVQEKEEEEEEKEEEEEEEEEAEDVANVVDLKVKIQ